MDAGLKGPRYMCLKETLMRSVKTIVFVLVLAVSAMWLSAGSANAAALAARARTSMAATAESTPAVAQKAIMARV